MKVGLCNLPYGPKKLFEARVSCGIPVRNQVVDRRTPTDALGGTLSLAYLMLSIAAPVRIVVLGGHIMQPLFLKMPICDGLIPGG